MVLKLKQLNTFFLRYQFLASEIHNLPDSLCLIDPPVTSSDGESQLNAPLHDSDGFNDKINKKILSRFLPNTGVAGRGGGGVAWPPTFYAAKIETIKRLSPKSKCYHSSNVYCFILKRRFIQILFSVPLSLQFEAALPNLGLICAALHRKLISLRCVLGGIFSYVLLLVMT